MTTNPILEEVARAVCKSRSCRGVKCCQWPAQTGERHKCTSTIGYADAARAAAQVLLRGMMSEADKDKFVDVHPNEPVMHAMQFIRRFASELGIEMEDR